MRSRWVAVPLAAGCALVAGCAPSAQEAVTDVVSDFREAVAAGDGGTACALLAEAARQELEQSSGKPCERAVLDEVADVSGTSGSAAVFGGQAMAGDGAATLFLSRYDAGWRVVAAGCSPTTTDRPYDCSVTVG